MVVGEWPVGAKVQLDTEEKTVGKAARNSHQKLCWRKPMREW